MELLKLSYWDPVRDMKSVLSEIRSMLQEHGKLDVNNPMNDIKQYPYGAYSRLEYLLLRLELLCEQDPRANLKYSMASSKITKQTTSTKAKREEGKEGDGKYWVSGTGYGHGNTAKTGWDVKAFIAAQRQKDLETQNIIEAINGELSSSEAVQFDVLEESCLVPVVESYLRNDSLLDMERHSALYISILTLVQSIANREHLLPLLDNLPHQSTSIFQLLSSLATQAQIFLRRLIPTPADNGPGAASMLALSIVDAHNAAEKGLERMKASILSLEASLRGGEHVEEKRASQMEDEGLYLKKMRALQFDVTQMNTKTHHYAAQIGKGVVNREKVLRLAQEQASLATSLPLNYSSSVFVRIDEQNMDIMQALITGPDDTPYSGGCFQFDIYFPPTYPNGPPQVNLQTTGGGSVRFNPNLYNCGKVCLSLLGTWSGAEGETWNKDTSTLLQVLVSIQSLILVPQPFFNEPGYEAQIGTPRGDQNSRQHNETLRIATIEHAMIGQLKCPPSGFEEVIRGHFYYKRDVIGRMCEAWLAEANQANSKAHYSKLLKVVKDLRDEFAKLDPPAGGAK